MAATTSLCRCDRRTRCRDEYNKRSATITGGVAVKPSDGLHVVTDGLFLLFVAIPAALLCGTLLFLIWGGLLAHFCAWPALTWLQAVVAALIVCYPLFAILYHAADV